MKKSYLLLVSGIIIGAALAGAIIHVARGRDGWVRVYDERYGYSFVCPPRTIVTDMTGSKGCADGEFGPVIAGASVWHVTEKTAAEWVLNENFRHADEAARQIAVCETIRVGASEGLRTVMPPERGFGPDCERATETAAYVVRQGLLYRFSIRALPEEARRFFGSVRFTDITQGEER